MNAQPQPAGSRWQCPKCRSLKVQVRRPCWFRERADFSTEFVGEDEGADITSWYCERCEQGDSGRPDLAPGAPS